MPRPQKCRRICAMPETDGFTPKNGWKETVVLSVDEYEVIRLTDLHNMTQEECASQMDIARTTVTAIYENARRKLADALVNSKRLLVQGGNVRICENPACGCKKRLVMRAFCLLRL